MVLSAEPCGSHACDGDRAPARHRHSCTRLSADPFVRWIHPQPNDYLTHVPRALQAFGGVAFVHGGVWRFGDFQAVALWMPPGLEPDAEATLDLFRDKASGPG